MLYYTQLIYIKKDRKEVLPLLEKHGGQLVYRVRPGAGDVIACTGDMPYEVHLVTFNDRAGFDAYRDDPDRLRYMQLKNESVERILLIEGQAYK